MQKKPRHNLPADIVEDILSRLPVKPLLRFRCVSKQWLDLVDSPDFIKLHLNRSIETRNNRSLVVKSYPGTFLMNVDSTDVAVGIDDPLKCYHFVMGSCNGLVLLGYVKECRYHDIVIWNPFTRNYHKLPGLTSYIFTLEVAYGIGYDSVHDDYKVVKINQFHGENGEDPRTQSVEVYSLKSNTWRRIHDDFPYFLDDTCDGVLSGGSLHWVSGSLIVAFDLATEEYRLVSMPNTVYIDHESYNHKACNHYINLAALEGCLCILSQYVLERIDVWVMKSYGVSESWTKLTSVCLRKEIRKFHWLVPLAFSKDGRELLVNRKEDNLILLDLESKAEKTVDVPCSQVEFVVQSLVPVGSGSGTHAQNQHRGEE